MKKVNRTCFIKPKSFSYGCVLDGLGRVKVSLTCPWLPAWTSIFKKWLDKSHVESAKGIRIFTPLFISNTADDVVPPIGFSANDLDVFVESKVVFHRHTKKFLIVCVI